MSQSNGLLVPSGAGQRSPRPKVCVSEDLPTVGPHHKLNSVVFKTGALHRFNIVRQNIVVAQHCDVDTAHFHKLRTYCINYSNRHKHEIMSGSTFAES